MIFCSCYRVQKETLTELIKQGKSIKEIQNQTQCGRGCGLCLKDLIKLFKGLIK
jgi:NAD(P)H-nitrite reductase large subunit